MNGVPVGCISAIGKVGSFKGDHVVDQGVGKKDSKGHVGHHQARDVRVHVIVLKFAAVEGDGHHNEEIKQTLQTGLHGPQVAYTACNQDGPTL